MTDNAPPPQVWPTLRATNARQLIRFLVDVFGFRETVVYGEGERVDHAQLSWPLGGGIMLGSARDGEARDGEGRDSEGRDSEGRDSEGRDSEGRDSEGRDSEGRDSEGRDSETRDGEADRWPLRPGQFGAYVVTNDPDSLYAKVVAAGVEVVVGLHDTDYGSRDFVVRDPEGNHWSFGTYRGEPVKS